MIEIVPFKAEHLMAMTLQPSQEWMVQHISLEGAKSLEGTAMTGFLDGEVVVCAGVTEYWPGRGFAWSFVSEQAKPHWKSIHSAVRRWLDAFAPRRTEAAAEYGPGFEARCRWLEHLGFTVAQERATAFLQNGGDARLYERVKGV